MTYSITKDGVALSKDLYTIDKNTKTFSSNESGLVLDFSDENAWVFNTWCGCTFNTGGYCTFNTGGYCTFNTGSSCMFNTGSSCMFDTVYNCTFKTGSNCTFKTGSNCSFNTGDGCVFSTHFLCEFTTKENCVLVRRDIYEIIEIPDSTTIKLHGYGVTGYDVIKKSECVKLEVEEIKKKIFDLVGKLTKVEE